MTETELLVLRCIDSAPITNAVELERASGLAPTEARQLLGSLRTRRFIDLEPPTRNTAGTVIDWGHWSITRLGREAMHRD